MITRHFRSKIALLLPIALMGLTGCAVEDPTGADLQPVDCSAPITSQGVTYTGARDGAACAWRGIPFAEAPVGELRFQYARPTGLKGDFDATHYGTTCLQGAGFSVESYRTHQSFGEDCLNLNIWTPGVGPEAQLRAKLPVMVWIYGGGFASGSGATELYNGEPFTQHDVVVVTLNYRLGALGWLAITDATDSDGHTLEGNYGLSDQIQALTWVRNNIAAFGGNPDNVTIFGESAGAYSVCALMASPHAAGLYHRAIMESGACLMAGAEKHAAYSRQWISDVGCPATAPESLECLRALDPQWLREHASWPLFEIDAPVVGGAWLPQQPYEALQGSGRSVPLLVGFNHDEVKLLGLANQNLMNKGSEPWTTTWANIESAVGTQAAEKLKAAYPRSEYPTPKDLLLQGATDVLFSCAAREAARTGSEPAYQYRFRITPDSFFLEPLAGTFHASEIPYVFGNKDLLRLIFMRDQPLEDALNLSAQMQTYWSNFAKTGDPNGGDLPHWEPMDKDQFLMELTTPLGSSQGEFSSRCDVWDAVLPRELNTRFYEFGPKLIGTTSIF